MLTFFTLWLIFTFIFYALYIEFSPGMGNIWWRTNSDGFHSFQPINLFNLIRQSFTPTLWKPELLDLNFIYFFLISFLLSIIIYIIIY